MSREVEGVAVDRDAFLNSFKDLPSVSVEQEADSLLYVGFTVIWTLVRSVIEAQGIYANHRNQCLDDFIRTCSGLVDIAPYEAVFDAWERWEEGAPAIDTMNQWYREIAEGAVKLRKVFGAESAEEFSGWPPPTI